MTALHRLEKIPVEIVDPPEALARAVAGRIADLIRARAAEGRRCVLGLATGSTPVGVYAELVRLHREEGLSFANVETFNLDEYWPMDPDSIHSYHRFMREHLFDLVDLDPARCHVPPGNVPKDEVADVCDEYERRIREAGGIDLQLLGIGKTGHIGFNEPGSGAESRTRPITLDTVTRRDAAADFFGEGNVPRRAITMGVATILEAREIVMLATGEHKAGIVRRAVEGAVDHQVAATFLQQHPHAVVYCDQAAAAELTRMATPWLLDEVEWTPELELRAVVWLARTVGKAILKLTEHDYAEHHLASLLARHGAVGVVNGLVFNVLGAKIRGRSKLPKGQRVICFSPHPDDDVISAGGILRKLVLNDNRITVAYMTSGNIAVFDHDVLRYVEVLERLASDEHLARRRVDSLTQGVREVLAAKQPGEVDAPEVQDLKRIIREGEAVSGIETLGLSRHDARFLNLPFYRTGKVKKDPIGPADVELVRELLDEVRPDLVLVAGDLSDPHGTHRLCKDAIDQALAELAPGGFSPEVWLYRGAWQEWPVTEATWLVPLAPEELERKIQAIFKHQSQKDSAPFPGQDAREFWQRVEARNKGTADLLNQLGLAEYFAMEAYVVG
ncbi:MAG: glucosamine-6-phosphate deaminase [Gemmatimonadales bacterium]|nr:glucosamine-6-phosphate deaminase [Gemmatimonadales bacterium]MDZ4389512.1 glucosamine-6-phosphate deaminase [Gemmatimonadales bacterium]